MFPSSLAGMLLSHHAPAAPEIRQNAIVDLAGLSGSWTGTQIEDFFNFDDTVGATFEGAGGSNDNDRFAYSAQAGVVTNNTVTSMQMGFMGLMDSLGEGCDLPARLMIAMQAVPLTKGGDYRCLRADLVPLGVAGTPAAGGFIKVQDVDGNFIIDINVIDDGKVDPTIELKSKYDEWRAANPCPPEAVVAQEPTMPPTTSGTETTEAPVAEASELTGAPEPTTNAPSSACFVKPMLSVSVMVVAAMLLN